MRTAALHILFQQGAGVVRADIHPEYDPWTVENDICLLTLDTTLQINTAVNVIRPAFTEEKFSGSARVSGWGTLSDGVKYVGAKDA